MNNFNILSENQTATCVARFRLAYDEKRAANFENTRISGLSEAFVVVKSVVIDGQFASVPGTKKAIDLGKSSTYRIPALVGQRLLSGIHQIGSYGYDCYDFASDVFGVPKGREYLEGWTTDFDRLPTDRSNACARMVPIDYARLDDMADPSREHWYLPIHPEQGGTVLHVAGTEGPLMLSPLRIVRTIYPGKIEALAFPQE